MTNRSDSRLDVKPGEILAGKYRVERVIGSGGMGVVVAAHHLHLDEKVALKFLAPEAFQRPDAAARFLREARAVVKIKSEHVARVADVGTLENGVPYMVMEYLEGADLGAWLRDQGALPIDLALEFVLQACVAVAEAHSLGIVHRDLKPSNLFCIRRADKQFCIKVLDFGISKLVDVAATWTAPGMAMTKTSVLMGSPLYMSPEQMRSAKDIDARSDIWALGVILFELISGRPPFVAETVTELAIKVANDPTPSLRAVRPDVSAQLEAAILRCMEKDRALRYRDVGELACALSPLVSTRGRLSIERISGIVQPAASENTSLIPGSKKSDSSHVSARTVPPESRTTGEGRRLRAAVIGSALVAGFGIAMAAMMASREEKSPRQAVRQASPAPSANASAPDMVRLAPMPEPGSAAGARPTDPPVVDVSALPTAAVVQHAPSPSTTLAPHPPAYAGTPTAAAAPLAPAARPRVEEDAGPGLKGYRDDIGSEKGANCDPPYYVDSKGSRVFKKECL